MSRREDIDNSIWQDPDFLDLTADAKLLYLWGFTNPRCNMAGIYKVDTRPMSLDTGLTGTRTTRAFAELCSHEFWAYHRPWLWIRSRVAYLRSTGPLMAKSVAKDIAAIPADNILRIAFLDRYGRTGGWGEDGTALIDLLAPLASESSLAEPNQETLSIPSSNGIQTVPGKGKGLKKEEPTTAVAGDFGVWLADHQAVTGNTPPREGTHAYRDILAAFTARREDYSLDELKFASRGAHADEHRRQNGYTTADSVLRPTKVYALIEKGRKVRDKQRPDLAALVCADCSTPIGDFELRNQSKRCDECYPKWNERRAA